MIYVGIFGNNLFTFPVSTLTFHRFEFLRDGNVVLWVLVQLSGAEEYTDCFSEKGVNPTNEGPGYDTKHSDDGAPVMQELWEMRSTSLFPLLPCPQWKYLIRSHLWVKLN